MNINDIYKKYKIPSNLSRHMLTVAKVVLFIKDHWNDKDIEIDWDMIVKSALLHDLGNIVKFNFEKNPEIMENEGEDIEYWKKIQAEMVKKYGRDDHEATRKMLAEIKIEEQTVEIILNKSFGNAKETAASNNWLAKILLYADLRVAPDGVATLEDRLEDVKKRLAHYSSRSDFTELLEAARNIEKQIQEKVNVSLSEISSESLENLAQNIQPYFD